MTDAREERVVRASQERPRAIWVTPIFWTLYVAHAVMRKATHWLYRTLRRVGYTMYDAPCPRCGESMWRLHEGCKCELTGPFYIYMLLTAGNVRTSYEHDGLRVQITTKSRRDLFHLGRGFDLHAEHVLENLRHDDEVAREAATCART